MKFIAVIAFLLSCLMLNAQINIGARGGISIPDLKGNNEQSKGYTSRLDGYGGVFVNFRLTRSLYLQPEINFSPQGGQRTGMQPVPSDAISGISLPPGMTLYANFKTVTMINYIEIPILLKLESGHKLKYFVCFGPHVSFLLEAKTKTSGSSSLYLDEAGTIPLTDGGEPLPAFSFDGTTNIKESIKKVNAGVQGGVGLQYPVGPGSVFIEGRGIIGLINIQTHPEIDGKNKTGSLAVSAGYMIKIK